MAVLSRRLIFILLNLTAVFLIFTIYFDFYVHATVSSCFVTIFPGSKPPSTDDAFAFSVNNTSSSATITWVRITGPSNITITSSDASSYTIDSSSQITITDLDLEPQFGYGYIVVGVTTGSEGEGNWTITASDSSDGSGATTCLGLFLVKISSDQSDSVAPELLTDSTASDVSDTSVKINWTTN